MPQGQVVYAQAPQIAYAGAQPVQYAYAAPPAGQVYFASPAGEEAGQQVLLQDAQQVFVEGMEGQVVQEGQQVLQEGQQVLLQEGQQLVYAAPEGAEAQQMMYAGAPVVAAAPARVNVSPELFAKLAAGGQMTAEEMAQLSGQPAPGQAEAGQPGSPVQPVSPMKQPTPTGAGAVSPGGANAGTASPGGAKEKKSKKEKKDKKDGAMKVSKKKEKGCVAGRCEGEEE